MKESNNVIKVIGWILRFVLIAVFAAAGFAGFQYFKNNKIKMERRKPVRQIALVETRRFEPASFQKIVKAQGTVVPARQMSLKSRISSKVTGLSDNFVRGGIVKKGEILAVLDDTDFIIEVAKAKAALEKVTSDLMVEQGNQKIATEEYKLIKKATNGQVAATDLALRKPQLIQARAAVSSAEAVLEKAQLDLSRTKITAPFNSLVLEKRIEPGSLVSTQETIATLVDTAAFHIEVLVPPDKLGLIRTGASTGSSATVRSQYSGQTYPGKVVRFTGQISEQSRMAGVLVMVADPLGLRSSVKKPPMMLGDHVIVEITGPSMENSIAIPQNVVRDRDTLWVLRSGKLEIVKVTPVYRDDTFVYISEGVTSADQIILTDLPAPVNGMLLRTPADQK